VLSVHRLDIGAETGARDPRVLLLAWSSGLGGGVERYLATVEERLRTGGASVHRINLYGPASLGGPRDRWARTRFAGAAVRAAAGLAPLDAIVTGHLSLIPVAAAAATVGRAPRGPVVFHGADGAQARRLGRALLTRHQALFPLTIGSYSAGALAGVGAAGVLRPGVASAWRAALLAAGARAGRDGRTPGPPTLLHVVPAAYGRAHAEIDSDVTAEGGLTTLLAALTAVRRAIGPVRLVVVAEGRAPEATRAAVAAARDVELVEAPGEPRLAGLYAGADLLVLAAAPGPGRGGEDQVRVLTEAQLAGCPVVGPVRGDARDAYVDGVTGVTPGDESPAALAAALVGLLADEARLARMRRRAAEWARMSTEPAEHTRAVFAALLGSVPPSDRAEVLTGPAGPASRAGSAPRPALTPPFAASSAASGREPARAPSPPVRRSASRVWPEPDDAEPAWTARAAWAGRTGRAAVPAARAADEADADADVDYAEVSRGWSEDIEIDDLRIR